MTCEVGVDLAVDNAKILSRKNFSCVGDRLAPKYLCMLKRIMACESCGYAAVYFLTGPVCTVFYGEIYRLA